MTSQILSNSMEYFSYNNIQKYRMRKAKTTELGSTTTTTAGYFIQQYRKVGENKLNLLLLKHIKVHYQ